MLAKQAKLNLGSMCIGILRQQSQECSMQTIYRKKMTKKMLLREINKKWPNDLAQKSKINVSSLAKQNEYIFFPPVYIYIYISNDLGKSVKKTANRDFHLTSYYRCLIKNSTSKSGHFLPHLYAQKPTSVE